MLSNSSLHDRISTRIFNDLFVEVFWGWYSTIRAMRFNYVRNIQQWEDSERKVSDPSKSIAVASGIERVSGSQNHGEFSLPLYRSSLIPLLPDAAAHAPRPNFFSSSFHPLPIDTWLLHR